jgi:hypothetical protein
MRAFRDWLTTKWRREEDRAALAQAYGATFATTEGQRVLRHLLDGVYCTVYEGRDPIEAAHHNGRRAVVQEILENVDLAEAPAKYRTPIVTEPVHAAAR